MYHKLNFFSHFQVVHKTLKVNIYNLLGLKYSQFFEVLKNHSYIPDFEFFDFILQMILMIKCLYVLII